VSRINRATHEFVEIIPRAAMLESGRVYISVDYTTAVHLCMCGCGTEVVTPIRPTEWSVTFDGETITLRPSIGNWRLPCRSHYLITNNVVRWLPDSGDAPSSSTPAGGRFRQLVRWFRRRLRLR
jgi:hypothetical protein